MYIVKYRRMDTQKTGYICASQTAKDALTRILSCYRADEMNGILGQVYYYMEGI